MNRGVIIAAPGSATGKTTVTLGLLRALARRGIAVRGAKSGPDYIDPRFHEAASGATCYNLDAWAMSRDRIADLVQGNGYLIIEGAMGLFDGAPPDGKGAVADLARFLDLPVVLVVDASHMAQSIRPLVKGFASDDHDVRIAGVILNKVGSPRHETMLRDALAPLNIPVFGALMRRPHAVPSRHLGLVQARETTDLDTFLDATAEDIADAIDLDAFLDLTAELPDRAGSTPLRPPAQRIAIAEDDAFAFAYPHILQDWRTCGAEISFFSPLADEAPGPDTEFVFLPGGYPELHAGRLASADTFRSTLRSLAKTASIYGECGGFMTLGKSLTGKDGVAHQMLGLLDLETSFAKRKLSLGYRDVHAKTGPLAGRWKAHEFHYATIVRAAGEPLFTTQDALGSDLPPMGLCQGRVSGSFAHLIDRA